MILLNFHFYDLAAAKLIYDYPCTLVEVDGNYNGSGNEFLQIFDKASTPVANDVPIKSFALTGAGPLPSIFQVLGTLSFTNGLAFGISTVNEKYTASASTWDIFGEIEAQVQPDLTGTVAQAQSTGADTYTVFNEPNTAPPQGPGVLVYAKVTNAEGATRYLMLFADANQASLDGSFPIEQWTIASGATIKLYFGRFGIQVVQRDSSGVLHYGCFLTISTTPKTLTQSIVNGCTFDANYNLSI